MINKESQLPLHHQIYTDILEKIKRKEYKEDTKLPSETELQEIYGVSRITVRRAMEDLQRDGYTMKRRGIGTVVCKPKRRFDLQKLSSFSEDNQSYGEKSTSVLLKFDEIIPEDKIASLLNIDEADNVYYIERIRLSEGKVIGLHRAYIKQTNKLNIEKSSLKEDTSLYDLLRDNGIILDHAEEKLEARISDQELNEILKVDEMIPIFYKERLTYDVMNEPIEYVEMYYKANMYQYTVMLDLKKDSNKR